MKTRYFMADMVGGSRSDADTKEIAVKLAFAFILALLIFASSVSVVWAGDDDEEGRGRKAPEVPLALVYPAAGLVGYGLYRVTHWSEPRKH
ncbi:MAG: hypothetical protein M1370_10030 [Bacteroidetes bacterium]|nr:hypothetical protein [Bacteroidota bacterium]MCL5025000.1 hypothetical protein [Chloroflexota bacterium]